MSFPTLRPINDPATTGNPTLIYWPALSVNEKAFVAAYVENAYSIAGACEALNMNRGDASRMLRNVTIRKAISEVQSELDGIDWLNEKWVKAQLLRIFPIAMGDEPAPTVLNTGEEVSVRKYDGNLAMKIVEYVVPKTQKQSVDITVNNIHRLTDEQLEEIAARGLERVVSEQ
jgi:hypothetical protein